MIMSKAADYHKPFVRSRAFILGSVAFAVAYGIALAVIIAVSR
jgi:hypothetical protein